MIQIYDKRGRKLFKGHPDFAQHYCEQNAGCTYEGQPNAPQPDVLPPTELPPLVREDTILAAQEKLFHGYYRNKRRRSFIRDADLIPDWIGTPNAFTHTRECDRLFGLGIDCAQHNTHTDCTCWCHN